MILDDRSYEMNEKKKALVVTTVASTIDQFCMNDISILLDNYDVQVAANFTTGNNTSKERINEFKNELINKNIVINEAQFDRNPLSKSNLIAYKKIKSLIKQNKFDLIHCHTPIAAMLTRLAARELRKKGIKVIYTAHGFHFHNGAPLINWLLYYPIEKWLARYTDTLITINKEDYERAKSKLKAKKVEYIPGVGIDLEKINLVKVDKDLKRSELGLPKDAFIVLSVGELNKNKNHEVVIRAIAKLNNPDIYYVICGKGQLSKYLANLSKELGIENQVYLLGFRKDITEICKSSDLFVFPSYREGLGIAALEAMSCGLPIITSNVHGIVDYSTDGKTGYICKPTDVDCFSKHIKSLYNDLDKRSEMALNNIEVVKIFEIKGVKNIISNIYESLDT